MIAFFADILKSKDSMQNGVIARILSMKNEIQYDMWLNKVN